MELIKVAESHSRVSLIQMLSFQGGLSTGFKNYIAEKGLEDETYTSDSVALIRISGTSVHNNKATQVDAVSDVYSSTSL